MKKLLVISVLSALAIFLGCRKDEDPEDGTVTLRVHFVALGSPDRNE